MLYDSPGIATLRSNPIAALRASFKGCKVFNLFALNPLTVIFQRIIGLMDLLGFEPKASALQTRRSSN